MKNRLFFLFNLLILSFSTIKAQDFIYHVDLVNIQNDRIKVGIKLTSPPNENAVFYFPKVVPGTYSISDFGRFIHAVKFYDKKGNVLPSKKLDVNLYSTLNGSLLDSISYEAEDTWDAKIRKNEIFYPTGTRFEENNVFVLNSGAYLGCILGNEHKKGVVKYKIPGNKHITSTLKSTSEIHVFESENYHELIDAPALVCSADTASFFMDGKKISVASFSENNKKMTHSILPQLKECMQSILNFWGYLPVDHYGFMFYFMDMAGEYNEVIENPGLLKLMKHFKDAQSGALEHKHSSFYVLFDMGENMVSPVFKEMNYDGFMNEVVIHEYMHTIAPIGLHSEEIGLMDYYNPSVSKHLWLYEGITEYFSSLIMVQNNMITMEEFFNIKMKKNVERSAKYPFGKVSFTQMSQHVLEKKYNKHYHYVYTYGALLGFLLDVEIVRLSNGEMTLKDVVKELYEKYGYSNSFKDDDFINEFLTIAPKGLDDFFNRYIIGNEKPDYNQFIESIGVQYIQKDSIQMPGILNHKNGILGYTSKRIPLYLTGNLEIVSVNPESALRSGDVLNIYEMDKILRHGMKPLVMENDTVYLTVQRKNEKVKIPFCVQFEKRPFSDVFIINDQSLEKELLLRNAWLQRKQAMFVD